MRTKDAVETGNNSRVSGGDGDILPSKDYLLGKSMRSCGDGYCMALPEVDFAMLTSTALIAPFALRSLRKLAALIEMPD